VSVEINLQALAIAIAGLALLFAGGTFWRTGDWRKSDAWTTLTHNVASVTQKVTALEGKTGELPSKIGSINDRLTRVEAHLDDMPSKADIAELRATLDAQGSEIDVVRDTVKRIEDWLRSSKS
jgi:chromosome segregation ATPase